LLDIKITIQTDNTKANGYSNDMNSESSSVLGFLETVNEVMDLSWQ